MNTSRIIILALASALSLAACGPPFEGDATSKLKEVGKNASGPQSPSAEKAEQTVVTDQALDIYALENGVLVSQAKLPIGTELTVPPNYQTSNLNYQDASGNVERSSTGFIFPLQIVSVPANAVAHFPNSVIDRLNTTAGGLYVSAAIVGNLQGLSGSFNILSPASAGSGFLANFQATGQPKFNYLKSVTKRFGARLNKGVDPNSLSAGDQIKWSKIYEQLKDFADRSTVQTPKSLIMIDLPTAKQWSLAYETTGAIAPNGAWTIAVQSTAVRHGFANTPCAEFMSELVREAYQRSGYRSTDDFNSSQGNELIWSNTAAVVNFSKALYTAGWIPWDTRSYRPISGALLMNGAGETPGHTFISAGDSGRFIVDNGSPQGRDLRSTSLSIINMMYQPGVFFLPPGINPPKW